MATRLVGSPTIGDIEPVAETATATKPRSGSVKRWLFTAVRILISTTLIYYLLTKAHLDTIWAYASSANLWLILLSFLLHGIGYSSSAYRWQILLRAQGIDIPVGYLVKSYAVAMFFNNLLPTTIGGDAYRAYDTAKCGVSRLKALAVVVVERFLGLLSLLIFGVLALALAAELTTQIEGLWVWSLSTLAVMLAALWFIFFRHGRLDWLREILHRPGLRIIGKPIAKIGDAFTPFKGKVRALGWSMVLSLFLQLIVILHYYLISEALGLSIPFVKFLVIIPVAMFVQMIPLSINGIGIRESVYVFFLTKIYGAPIEAALAFSWIAYAMILLLGVLGGVIYALRK